MSGTIEDMLSQPQLDCLWNCKVDAEARACYFADIASKESTVKRWIVGGTFILSSAAVVALLSSVSSRVSLALAAAIALANGYQIAVGQDAKIKTAGRLHLAWLQLEHEYDRLWSHTYEDGAEVELSRLRDKERDLSETAATEIGHQQKRWKKWVDLIQEKSKDAGYVHEPTPPTSAGRQTEHLASVASESTATTSAASPS